MNQTFFPNRSFFFVHRTDGTGTPPSKAHTTEIEAKREAARLASLNPGVKYEVQQTHAIASVVAPMPEPSWSGMGEKASVTVPAPVGLAPNPVEPKMLPFGTVNPWGLRYAK